MKAHGNNVDRKLGSGKGSIAIEANAPGDSVFATNGTRWKRNMGMSDVRWVFPDE
jgi:hypothetical protein